MDSAYFSYLSFIISIPLDFALFLKATTWYYKHILIFLPLSKSSFKKIVVLVWWYMPVIPGTWEVDIRKTAVWV
jgi:hypothetical protein